MQHHLYPRIVADSDILSGKPITEGTRVLASVLVEQMAAGKSLDQVAREHGVRAEDVRAALEYAAWRVGEPASVPGAASKDSDDGIGTPEEAPSPADEEARKLGLDPTRLSPLGRRLLVLRAEGSAAGETLLGSWEELDAEIAERRGSRYPEVDE